MNIKILKQPHLTEKTVLQKELHNQVTFLVERTANKIEIKRAIEGMFKVSISQVRVINMQGKIKRMGRFSGKRPNWKKAIVTLKQGDNIEYFEGA